MNNKYKCEDCIHFKLCSYKSLKSKMERQIQNEVLDAFRSAEGSELMHIDLNCDYYKKGDECLIGCRN